MTYRVRNIGIAVALAVIAALLTSFYVTNYKRHVQRGEDHVTVLVAKHDIPVGTAGSDAVGMMSTTEVPRRSVVPGSISSPDEIKSLVASQETFAGEQITTQRFSSVAQTGVEGQLRGNLRAFQVAGDQNQLLAGTLKDNDHVDLVAAITVGTSGTDYVFSRVVLRDLKVLQAPSTPAPGAKITGGAGQTTYALIAMTDSQAQKFQWVLTNADSSTSPGWHLELRPITHATDSPDHLDSVKTVLRDGLSRKPIREYTKAPVILLASGGSPSLLEDALEADVADVILLPQLTDNVVFAIRKACHSGRKQQASGGGRQGRLVTVFSPKGGTGKTVLSTNISASLAKHWGKRALLLDLDLQFGDAAIMLGIEPDQTIYDLVTAPGELDSEKLAGYTTRHGCGLDVLPAPLRPEDAELVTEAKLARLLEVARESYDVIVVDTSPFFHGPMLATLDRTDELLLVCGLDVPTLKNVRLSLQTLELLSFPPDRIKLVLNRANSKVGMKPKEVESALEREIAYEVPSDRIVPLAVNRGNPAVLSDAKADFSRAVREMAKQLVAAQAAAKQKKSFLASLGRS